jgi:predicted ArsR family transcriptional regulator
MAKKQHLRILRDNFQGEEFTPSEVAGITGFSYEAVRRQIVSFVEDGILEAVREKDSISGKTYTKYRLAKVEKVQLPSILEGK